MTPKLFKTLALSSIFVAPALATESAEPIPTDAEVLEINVEDDEAARKRKKRNRNRQRAQRSRTRSAENRAERAENRAERSENRAQQQRSESRENRAERAENRVERAENRANRAERAARQQRMENRAQQRRQAQRRAERRADHREEAARRAARHTHQANRRAAAASHSRAHGHAHGGTHVRPNRWHNRWSHNHHRRHVRWYHGVFVYGPSPHRHHRVRQGVYNDSVPLPARKIDRKGVFSVGLTTGSYMSGYGLGGDFSDFGMGVNARFRPVEGLGFEVGYSVHDDTFDSETERTTAMLQPSVQVFAAPWSRISPYASVGVTFTERVYNDTWSDGLNEYTTKINDQSFGPHAGIGLEIALGQNAAIDLEARAIGYLDNQEGGTVPGAVQTTFGAQWYF